jgi:hypothetical protein
MAVLCHPTSVVGIDTIPIPPPCNAARRLYKKQRPFNPELPIARATSDPIVNRERG